jgi:hypothetical protein
MRQNDGYLDPWEFAIFVVMRPHWSVNSVILKIPFSFLSLTPCVTSVYI